MHAAIVPSFKGQVMAVERVEQLLHRSTQALDAAGVLYAVVGGNAVAAWVRTVDEGAVRATKDVDVMIRRSDLPAVIQAMRGIDLDYHEVHGVSMFLDRERPSPKTGLHLLFANEPVSSKDPQAAPDVLCAVRSDAGYRVLDLPSLLILKLMAFRDVDRVHIRDLLSLDLIGEDCILALPEALRPRLRQIQATPNG